MGVCTVDDLKHCLRNVTIHGMRKNIVTGIDIGTFNIKVVITQSEQNGAPPHIIGTGMSRARGLRNGYIINKQDAVVSIEQAVEQAQKEANIKITKAYIAIGGIGVEDLRTTGEAIVSRANSEVAENDTENALIDAEAKMRRELVNRKVIHSIPIHYLLNGQKVLGSPLGMQGSKIEVSALLVTVLSQHLNDIISAVEAVGIQPIDIMAAPIAASLVTLTKQQKMVGCVLANIGAETLSIAVFEENTPISIKIFPIGSTDITNTIALDLRIPLHEAEQLKRGAVTGLHLPQKKLDDIIASRMKKMFSLIHDHLKNINRAGLLPAGIILTGGGAGISTAEDYARIALKLPCETAGICLGEQRLKDASWAVAYGLCIWGASADTETIGIDSARSAGVKILSWFKQFLP